MVHPSKIVSIHPYFRAKPGQLESAKALLPKFIEKASTETDNAVYDFTLSGDAIFCREAYVGAQGLLHHLENINALLTEFLRFVDILRVEVHGSKEELEKLKQPLAHLKPQWFEFFSGVAR